MNKLKLNNRYKCNIIAQISGKINGIFSRIYKQIKL